MCTLMHRIIVGNLRVVAVPGTTSTVNLLPDEISPDRKNVTTALPSASMSVTSATLKTGSAGKERRIMYCTMYMYV